MKPEIKTCECKKYPLIYTGYIQNSNAAATGFPCRWVCDIICSKCDKRVIGESPDSVLEAITSAIRNWNNSIETFPN